MLVYTFFVHSLTSLISAFFLFPLTQAEKGEVVANCDHLQNLTAPPKPGSRPIATNMSYVARFANAFSVAAMVSTLSRHLRWKHVVNRQQMHKDGITTAEYWTDLPRKAVLCADTKTRYLCARTLTQRKLSAENRLGSGDFNPTSNKIKAMATKVNKGLEFPVVALPDVGQMPAPGEDDEGAASVFYVAATKRLLMGFGGYGSLGKRVGGLVGETICGYSMITPDNDKPHVKRIPSTKKDILENKQKILNSNRENNN